MCVWIKNNYNCSHDFVFQECRQHCCSCGQQLLLADVVAAGHVAAVAADVAAVVAAVVVEAISF